MFRLLIFIKQHVGFRFHALQERVLRWTKPPTISLLLDTLADLARGKSELMAENALLRYQLIILRRQVKRPTYRKADRLLLVVLARMVRTWKQALFLVQPETLLRWHRELFRVFWKHKSKAHTRKPKLSPETIGLIQEMAANNRLWGAERMRGELLKLDIRGSQTNYSEVHAAGAVLATWVIRSKTNASRRRTIDFLCLQTETGWCTIRSRHQHPHARTTIFSHDGETAFMGRVFTTFQRLLEGCLHVLSLPLATLTDLGRNKSELIAENALLR